MRLVHTADWHIGATLRGFARDHEHQAVLAGLTRIVAEREADALIVAGDIFDSQNPSGEAQRLLYDALAALHAARPGLTVVLTAGNHDAAGRLEAPRALLGAIGVHVVGNVRRTRGRIDPARHLISLPARSGQVGAHVLAVSYPTAACLPPWTRLTAADGSPIAAATRLLYEEMIEGVRDRLRGSPLIVTGHLHVAGGIESEGAERRILVGGEHAVSPDIFPAEAAYVALGHLHKAQAVGRDSVRYSGSLIPLSATELGYDHGVTLIDLEGGKALIEHVPLARPVPFLRLPRSGTLRLDTLGDHLEALGLDASLPVEWSPFVQVHVDREGLDAGFRAEVDRIAEAFPVRLVDLRLPAREAAADPAQETSPGIRLVDLAPEEMFRRAFEAAHGTPPEARHLDVFHRAAAAV